MEELHKLKEKLYDELEEIARKSKMSAGDLDVTHKLTDTIKNIDKICMMEDEGGYSYDDEMSMRGGRRDGVRDGRRGGDRNPNRDRRGRYMDGYSQDDGGSKMMEHLEMALEEADEEDRENILRMMRRMKQNR